MTAFLAALWRFFPPKVWAFIAIAGLAAVVGLGIYFAGRGDERDAADRRQHKTEARASAAREAAGTDIHLETSAITAAQKERDHAAHALPDSPPDDRELRRRCRQLRDVGRDHPACRNLAGPAQARAGG